MVTKRKQPTLMSRNEHHMWPVFCAWAEKQLSLGRLVKDEPLDIYWECFLTGFSKGSDLAEKACMEHLKDKFSTHLEHPGIL